MKRKTPKEHFINACCYLLTKLTGTVPADFSVLEKKNYFFFCMSESKHYRSVYSISCVTFFFLLNKGKKSKCVTTTMRLAAILANVKKFTE